MSDQNQNNQGDKTLNNNKLAEEASVSIKLLQEINEKLEKNDKIIQEQAEEIKKLTFAADVSRLDQYDAKHRGSLIRKVKLNLFSGKIVRGWKTVKDEVGVNKEGVLVENQTVKLFLDEGDGEKMSSIEIPIVVFSRGTEKLETEIIKRSTTSDGIDTMTVKLSDGREIEMDVRFLN